MADEKKSDLNEFQFVQEKIKRPSRLQNKLLRRTAATVFLAVVFGAVSCVTFALLQPWAREQFGEEPVKEISIPRDEEPAAEPETAVPQEPIVITETTELELEDYSKLFTKMRAVEQDVQKSLVTVTAGRSDMDWFNELYESESQVSGLLVGDNGVEELILTNYSDISGADQLTATFADGSSAEAALKKYDRTTDLAIVSVNRGSLKDTTLEQIKTVTWGSSRAVRAGDPIIAIGSPAGISGSLLFGNLTAVSYNAIAVDGEYQLLITDLDRSSHANGALVNFKGEIVGWLQDTYLHSNNKEALTAYGISDLKSVIEHLCNNQDIVYLGIRGADVTEEIQEKQGLPAGVYITSVEMDSPAMAAGIQSGDILVDISGREIRTLSQVQEVLLNFSEDQVIPVKIMRQGKEGLKEIECSAALSSLK